MASSDEDQGQEARSGDAGGESLEEQQRQARALGRLRDYQSDPNVGQWRQR